MKDFIKPGSYVRFRFLPKECKPHPLYVSKVLSDGTVVLIGGERIQPHLLVVVEPPKQHASPANSRRLREQL